MAKNFLTSLHGRRFGLGNDDELIVQGDKVMVDPNVEIGNTATNIKNSGITTVGSTAAGNFTLDEPQEGVTKYLYCTANSSLGVTVTAGSSLVSIGANSSENKINFTAAGQGCTLAAISATKWALVGKTSSLVTVSS